MWQLWINLTEYSYICIENRINLITTHYFKVVSNTQESRTMLDSLPHPFVALIAASMRCWVLSTLIKMKQREWMPCFSVSFVTQTMTFAQKSITHIINQSKGNSRIWIMLYLVSLPLYATLQFMAHANIRLFLTDTFAYINLDFKVSGIWMYVKGTLNICKCT